MPRRVRASSTTSVSPRTAAWPKPGAVFLEGVRPSGRVGRPRPPFTVAELGFGTGLNVLALIELWRRTPSQPTPGSASFRSRPSRFRRRTRAAPSGSGPELRRLGRGARRALAEAGERLPSLHRPAGSGAPPSTSLRSSGRRRCAGGLGRPGRRLVLGRLLAVQESRRCGVMRCWPGSPGAQAPARGWPPLHGRRRGATWA